MVRPMRRYTYSNCNVDRTNSTGESRPGTHRIGARRIGEANTTRKFYEQEAEPVSPIPATRRPQVSGAPVSIPDMSLSAYNLLVNIVDRFSELANGFFGSGATSPAVGETWGSRMSGLGIPFPRTSAPILGPGSAAQCFRSG
jgi:hypothetical protein